MLALMHVPRHSREFHKTTIWRDNIWTSTGNPNSSGKGPRFRRPVGFFGGPRQREPQESGSATKTTFFLGTGGWGAPEVRDRALTFSDRSVDADSRRYSFSLY